MTNQPPQPPDDHSPDVNAPNTPPLGGEDDHTRTLDMGGLPRTTSSGHQDPSVGLLKILAERPKRAGPFRIEGDTPLGSGGFGAVWLGIRDDGAYTQKVAVKVLTRTSTNDQLVTRFELERQVMASIKHPNIAHIIDGGTLDDGRPWLAMELIEHAMPITAWCDRHRLNVTERLKLFQSVCSAIDHVHRNGFIHRDIKPDNILVDAEGVAKVLDFGIARIINEEASAFGQRINEVGFAAMTPVYASPEQVRCEQVTTLSDVYSLGVLLYEMLSGHLPFEGVMANRGNLFIAKEETLPDLPSSMITITPDDTTPASELRQPERVMRTRSTTSGRLRKRLVGDLDRIVLKSLATEPEDRYQSAIDLTRDIDNHFQGLPIEAAPDRAGYRFGKWLSRNRMLVGMAGAIAVALVLVGVTFSFIAIADAQRARAATAEANAEVESQRRASAEDREAALQDLEQELAEMANANVIGALREAGRIDGAQRVLESTLIRIEALRANNSKNAALQLMEARVLQELARTFFSRRNPSLEDPAGFRRHWTKAHSMVNALLKKNPTAPDTLLIAARLERDHGDLDFYAPEPRLDASQERYDMAIDRLDAFEAAQGNEVIAKTERSMVLTKLGDIAHARGHSESASLLRRDVLTLERAIRDSKDTPETRRNLAIALGRVASDALQRQHPSEARDYFERSFELRQRIARELPNERRAMRDLANGHEWMGRVLRDRDTEAARDHYAKYFNLVRTLAWMQPLDERAFKDAVNAHGRLLRLYTLHPDNDTVDYQAALLDYRNQLFLPRLACLPDDRVRWIILRNTRLLAQVESDPAAVRTLLKQAAALIGELPSGRIDDPLKIRDLVRLQLLMASQSAPPEAHQYRVEAQASLDRSASPIDTSKVLRGLQTEIETAMP